MNLVLENTEQVRFFTNMKIVIEALGISPSDFDWYVSDIETNINCAALGNAGVGQWITGNELESILGGSEIQFIWGVFSAVPVGNRPNITKLPIAQGNTSYWSEQVLGPQLEGAKFEIACWDSSATILVGLNDSQSKSFCTRFSDAKALPGTRQQL